MPTAKRPSGVKRAAQPSKDASAKLAKSARKASTVAGKEALLEEHADATKSFKRDAATKLRTWVSESKANKPDAKKADVELYNKKAELLRGVLQQMIGQGHAGELHNNCMQKEILPMLHSHLPTIWVLLQVAQRLPTKHEVLTQLLRIPQCASVAKQSCSANTPAASIISVKPVRALTSISSSPVLYVPRPALTARHLAPTASAM